jgi:TatD DNase family protein
MSVSLIDAHNHLQDARLAPHLDQIAVDCRAAGITGMVVNATAEDDWERVAETARRFDFVIPSYGVHPWHVSQCTSQWRDKLERRLDRQPVAVGEIGLDRWIPEPDLPRQEEIFVTQMQIAAERNLPVTIHCLKAWGRLLELLQNTAIPQAGFLLHSYSGSAEMIPRFADLGGYFSISGHFAHERKGRQREVFQAAPADRLLVETDAPDMLPPPGLLDHPLPAVDLNHPANLTAVYRFAAELRGESFNSFANAIAINFRRLFATVLPEDISGRSDAQTPRS